MLERNLRKFYSCSALKFSFVWHLFVTLQRLAEGVVEVFALSNSGVGFCSKQLWNWWSGCCTCCWSIMQQSALLRRLRENNRYFKEISKSQESLSTRSAKTRSKSVVFVSFSWPAGVDPCVDPWLSCRSEPIC